MLASDKEISCNRSMLGVALIAVLLVWVESGLCGVIIEAFPLPEADAAVWQVGSGDGARYAQGWLPLDEAMVPVELASGADNQAVMALSRQAVSALVPQGVGGAQEQGLTEVDRFLLEWVLADEDVLVSPPFVVPTEEMLLIPALLRLPDVPIDWD